MLFRSQHQEAEYRAGADMQADMQGAAPARAVGPGDQALAQARRQQRAQLVDAGLEELGDDRLHIGPRFFGTFLQIGPCPLTM